MSKRKHDKHVEQRERLKVATGAEEDIEARREREEREGTEHLADEPHPKRPQLSVPPRPSH